MNKKIHPACSIGFVLLIIGGLNLGLVGLFDFDVINALFGKVPLIERLVYVMIGLSAVGIIIEVLSRCRICENHTEKHTDNTFYHARA
ncbi:MAG: DUF378 domain-containing protein [Phycisphaerae bacterium]